MAVSCAIAAALAFALAAAGAVSWTSAGAGFALSQLAAIGSTLRTGRSIGVAATGSIDARGAAVTAAARLAECASPESGHWSRSVGLEIHILIADQKQAAYRQDCHGGNPHE